MRSSRLSISAIVLAATATWVAGSATALAQGPTFGLGSTPSTEEMKARDTAVSPQGTQLPPGSGGVKEGADVYAKKCASCHGPNGKGTPLHRGLVPLGNAKPLKMDGSLRSEGRRVG